MHDDHHTTTLTALTIIDKSLKGITRNERLDYFDEVANVETGNIVCCKAKY